MMELSNSTVKTPEAESETPTRIQQQPATAPTSTKPSPFSNGVLKRHAPLQHLHSHHHLNHHHHHPVVVTYKECLKNHAATLGGHALDGCGEFMPSPTSNPSDPTSLKCAACGCHRNFHRREPDDTPPLLAALPALEYQPHHRHHPPPPPPRVTNSSSPNNSPSPPPISSSYYPSAPHMLLALSHGHVDNNTTPSTNPTTMINATTSAAVPTNILTPSGSATRKRFRTKFTQEQKDRMLEFAERVGWKMQKRDEDVITEFCNEAGVDKGVFKVWMHNNKNTFGRKSVEQHVPAPHHHSSSAISTPVVVPAAATNGNGTVNYGDSKQNVSHVHQVHQDMISGGHVNAHGHDNHPHGTNGSSSSS